MMRVVQLAKGAERCVALVQEPHLVLLSNASSVAELAQEALQQGASLKSLIESRATADALEYDSVYEGQSAWQLRPPIHADGT